MADRGDDIQALADAVSALTEGQARLIANVDALAENQRRILDALDEIMKAVD